MTTKAMGEAISPLKDRFGCLTAVQLSNQIARNELSAILERLTGCAQGNNVNYQSNLIFFDL